jgi:uncharacterized membrane protein
MEQNDKGIKQQSALSEAVLLAARPTSIDVDVVGDSPKTTPRSAAASRIPNAVDATKRMIKTMILSFSLGFRCIFVAIPFMFYSIGPEALIISTGIMLIFIYFWDHGRIKSTSPADKRST